MLGGGQRTAQELQLLLHQEARRRRAGSGLPLGRGVGAVGRAKGVVDVQIGQRGQLRGEGRIVLLLFGVEARVLQQEHVARLGRLRRPPLPLGPTQSSSLITGRPSSSDRRRATGSILRSSTTWPLGRPRCEQRISVASLSSRYWMVGRAARMRVSSATVGRARLSDQRHVKVDADQDSLALHVDVANGLFVHGFPPNGYDRA